MLNAYQMVVSKASTERHQFLEVEVPLGQFQGIRGSSYGYLFAASDSFITLYFYHLVGNGTIHRGDFRSNLEKATVAFGESGYDATSLDDLARSLDIRKQSILYHYASKNYYLRHV